MLNTKQAREKLKQRMIAGALSRQGRYFRRPLHVNGKPTAFKVVKIKDQHSLGDQLLPLIIWPENECYLIPHRRFFSTIGFASACDVVVCDRSGKVIKLLTMVGPDSEISWDVGSADLWFFAPATAASLKIGLGATVSTKDTVVIVRKSA